MFSGCWLTRLVFQRALGVCCLIAFLVALNQFKPLLGERGLLPAPLWVKQVPFRSSPSLFYLFPIDAAFTTAAWLGVALSCLVIAGLAERYGTWFSALVWALIWALYISFVNVGQVFYGFGWESILIEACFFSIFLGDRTTAPQAINVWIFRWLLFRVMFGAGLIKLRGDPCWRDLSCLDYHFETQPMPNPLSWYLHWMPHWVHQAGVLFNHLAEVIAPFGYFAPPPISTLAALITIAFQTFIMASGNLSWLNLLTIVLAVMALDDRFLSQLIPLGAPPLDPPDPVHRAVTIVIAVAVALMSIRPILNMVSPQQIMNFTYNPLHLVSTYGAFGSITRQRMEVVVEGTAEGVITPATKWFEYEFKGKPNDPRRGPPQIAPYHLRLDWLMWFAAMGRYDEQPWFVNFVAKLLEGDKPVLGLLGSNPFPNHPPRFVRALLYEYRFTTAEERRASGQWWSRKLAGDYFPPVSLETPEFRSVLEREGWMAPEKPR